MGTNDWTLISLIAQISDVYSLLRAVKYGQSMLCHDNVLEGKIRQVSSLFTSTDQITFSITFSSNNLPRYMKIVLQIGRK